MPYKEFRHSINRTHGEERMLLWKEFLPLVAEDWGGNAEAATEYRQARYELPYDLKPKKVVMDMKNAEEKYWS